MADCHAVYHCWPKPCQHPVSLETKTNMECPPSRSGGFGSGGLVFGFDFLLVIPGQLPPTCLLPAAFWPAASVLAGSFMAKSAILQLDGGRTNKKYVVHIEVANCSPAGLSLPDTRIGCYPSSKLH